MRIHTDIFLRGEENPEITCRNASHEWNPKYDVLTIGEVTFFPERRHLEKLHKVIGDYLEAEAIANDPVEVGTPNASQPALREVGKDLLTADSIPDDMPF